jgi:tRNA(Ile)-lysidine synthase
VWRPVAANDRRVDRFRADLEALTGSPPSTDRRLALAVSGGPDSTAMLLLAAAAYPGLVAAATVDHRLRVDAAAEAQQVAALCARLAVPHDTLVIAWEQVPTADIQAAARERRYAALAHWARGRGCAWLAVAHHLDDQAETLLMRLARGSGVGGAAGARPLRALAADHRDAGPVHLIRPLLGWRRKELVTVVEEAGLVAVDDPTNRDLRHDRTRARRALEDVPWLSPERLAAAAAHFGEADEALEWVGRMLWPERAEVGDGAIWLDPTGLPRELQRRMLTQAIDVLATGRTVPGPKLVRVLDALLAGRVATIAGIKCTPGARWRLIPAPPRRTVDCH